MSALSAGSGAITVIFLLFVINDEINNGDSNKFLFLFRNFQNTINLKLSSLSTTTSLRYNLLFLFIFFSFQCLHFSSPFLLKHFSSSLHILLSFSNTLTFHINSSTFVTKLEFAFTCHMIASLIFLHPEFALGTLFEFLPLYKFHKGFIIGACCVAYLVLFATHIFLYAIRLYSWDSIIFCIQDIRILLHRLFRRRTYTNSLLWGTKILNLRACPHNVLGCVFSTCYTAQWLKFVLYRYL